MPSNKYYDEVQKNDSLSAYLAENPLEDILQGSKHMSSKNGSSSDSGSDCTECANRLKTIQTLKKQVKTAAEVGRALLIRHEDYIAETEKSKQVEHDKLASSEAQLQTALEETTALKSTELEKQLNDASESLFISDAKVEQLTLTVQEQQSQLAKASHHANRIKSQDDQISKLESARDNLQQELQIANKERKMAETRWRKTERLLETLTVQYEKLEQSIENNKNPDLKRETAREGPIQGFVKKVLSENQTLESTIVDLKHQLYALKEEINDLRSQPQGDSSSHGNSKEVHHHHHFHVVPSNFQPNHQSTPDYNQRQVTYNTIDTKAIAAPSSERSLEAEAPISAHSDSRLSKRPSFSLEAREDDSDTYAGDEVSDNLSDTYTLFGAEQNTVRKLISHDAGLRNLMKDDIPVLEPVMYSHYPTSPRMMMEEDEDYGIVYSPMPKLRRTTSHDSIFSGVDVASLKPPGSPFLTPSNHADLLNMPEITSHYRPSTYGTASRGSKSEVANISAEFTFPASQQTSNKAGSKMLLSAAVANNLRQQSSFVSLRPKSNGGTGNSNSFRSVSMGSPQRPNLAPAASNKWSTFSFFSKFRGDTSSPQTPPLPSVTETAANPPSPALKPQTTLCTSSPRAALSTPAVPVAPSRSTSTLSSSQYMHSLTTPPEKSAMATYLRPAASASSLRSTVYTSSIESKSPPPTQQADPAEYFDERALVQALNQAI